jgi:phage integrase family integrase/recombinase
MVCYIESRYFSSSIKKENTMSITKTKNGTYRLRIYIPEEVKSSLGVDKKVIEKRFKTRSEEKNTN